MNYGGIFEGARLDEELSELSQRIAAPGFWTNQAEAQKIMQRQRRVEGDVKLRESLKRRGDDLSVLFEWAGAGEDVSADLSRGLDELQQEVVDAETRKMLGGQYDRSNA